MQHTCHLGPSSTIFHLLFAICISPSAFCYLPIIGCYHLLLLLLIDQLIHISIRPSIDLSIFRLSIFSCLARRCMALCRCGKLHPGHRPVAVRSLGYADKSVPVCHITWTSAQSHAYEALRDSPKTSKHVPCLSCVFLFYCLL